MVPKLLSIPFPLNKTAPAGNNLSFPLFTGFIFNNSLDLSVTESVQSENFAEAPSLGIHISLFSSQTPSAPDDNYLYNPFPLGVEKDAHFHSTPSVPFIFPSLFISFVSNVP